MDQNLREDVVKRLEEELNTKIYPGTEIMKDVGKLHVHFVKATAGSHTVLVPQPSDDEHDPLNWSTAWKTITMFSATLVTFSQALSVLALAPMFGSYIQAYHSDLASVIKFTSTGIIALGFANFIWVPIQTCYGRRPVLIISSIICFGSLIWKAKATSYASFMGACALNGIGAAPSEAAQPTIIADILFLHNRGKYQTLYFSFYFGSLAAGPIISGPMAQYVGYQNFWWLNVALMGCSILCSIFLLPETRFRRALESSSSVESSLSAPTTEIAAATDSDKKAITLSEKNIDGSSTEHNPAQQGSWLGKGKPSRQQWKVFQPYEGNIFLELYLPLQMFFFPIVQFAAFVVSWCVSGFLMVNLTQLQAFAAPPYNLSPSKIGLFNLATLGGIIIGLLTAGPLSDAVAAWFTKRNKGVREPEMRLMALVPYSILMIIGNVVVAVGYQQGWSWPVIVIIGYTCIGIQTSAIPGIVATYAVDSYKPVAGAIFVAITINKNMWGYGFSSFITDWIAETGFITPIITNLALQIFFTLFTVVFWFYGKTFRKWTRNSKLHSM